MKTTDPRPRSAEELYTIYLARRQDGKKINDPERLIERKRMKGVH